MKNYTSSLLFIVLLSVCSCQSADTNSHSSENMSTASPPNPSVASFVNTIDPVCGMEVNAQSTDSFEHEGKLYGFCSASCRETFAKDPAKYIAKK